MLLHVCLYLFSISFQYCCVSIWICFKLGESVRKKDLIFFFIYYYYCYRCYTTFQTICINLWQVCSVTYEPERLNIKWHFLVT